MAEKKKKYMEKLKQCGKFDKFKLDHAEYMRQYRKRLTDEKKKKQSELSKLRMKKMRLKRKLEKKDDGESPRRVTRLEEERIQKQRKEWRVSKQVYRGKLQKERSQKCRRIREKDAQRKRQMRETDEATCMQKEMQNDAAETDGQAMTVSRSLWAKRKKERKRRSDVIAEAEIERIIEFYERPDISSTMPNKKSVSKKTMKPKMVLQRSIRETYNLYKSENPQAKLKISKFSSIRPKHVRPQREAKLFQCLCIYCTNIDLKVESINKLKDLPARIKDKYALLNETMCPPEENGFHARACVDRLCEKCPKTIPSVATVNNATVISWRQWERCNMQGSLTKRMDIRQKTGTVGELLEDLRKDLEPFARHLFTAKWQQDQLSKLTRDPPQGTMITIMDFSENYTCVAQEEVQSARWFQPQVTLFPAVCMYKCPATGEVIREAIHIISADKDHDNHAVAHFSKIIHDHITVTRKIKIEREIQFTDGCAAQFKSKNTLADISFSAQDFNFPVTRNFFESCHGKGPSDGEGGVVKSYMTRKVKSGGAIVRNAEEFYEVCASSDLLKTEGTFKRSFYLVHPAHIKRPRNDRIPAALKIGIRKLHSVKGLSPGVVMVRNLACFCQGCESEEHWCLFQNHVDPWKRVVLKLPER